MSPTPHDLCLRFQARIDRQVRFLLGSDHEHEDLVQDALLAVLQGVGSVRDATRLNAWVAQVTANTVRTALRLRRHRRRLSLDSVEEHELPAHLVDQDARELALKLLVLMDRLPRAEQQLLTSYWFTPRTVLSIAAESGCSLATLQRRLRRAQARFDALVRQDRALGASVRGGAPNPSPLPSAANRRGAVTAVRRRARPNAA